MKNRINIYLSVFNLFLVSLGVGLVIPVMPLLRESMNLSGATMGMMVSMFALSQLIVSPMAGFSSDKIGEKKIIIIGMLLFSISELIFGLSQSTNGFYFSRILGGVAAAFVFPAVTSYVAKITDDKERPKAMGIVSAAISGGFIVGPGLGGFLATLGIRTPFFVASVLGLVGFLLSFLYLKEVVLDTKKLKEKQSMKTVLTDTNYFIPFVIITISAFGLQAFESIYGVMTAINFNFGTSTIAFVITVSGIVSIVFQLLLFDRLINILGEVILIRLSFFSSAIFIGILALTKNNVLVMISTLIIFLSFNLIRPAITTYLSRNAGNNQGAVNGLNSTFTSLGNIIGPMVAGFLFDLNHFYPYYISAITLLLTGFLTFYWQKKVLAKN